MLKVVDLSLQNKKNKLVQNVSFEVHKGEVVGLMGPSGCGKSLTLNAILSLLDPQQFKRTGEVLYQDTALHALSENQWKKIRGKEIGMIFQEPSTALNPLIKIGEQITEGMRCHLNISAKEAIEKALFLLDAMGVSDPKKRLMAYPHELSGGIKQRIVITIALGANPKLVLADEPTTALDVTVQLDVLSHLKKLQKEQDFSLLLVSHDKGVMAHCCDRILVMDKGQIIRRGSVYEVL